MSHWSVPATQLRKHDWKTLGPLQPSTPNFFEVYVGVEIVRPTADEGYARLLSLQLFRSHYFGCF